MGSYGGKSEVPLQVKRIMRTKFVIPPDHMGKGKKEDEKEKAKKEKRWGTHLCPGTEKQEVTTSFPGKGKNRGIKGGETWKG